MSITQAAKRLYRSLPPYTLTVAAALAILWLTLAPQPTGEMKIYLFPHQDKAFHALMFYALTLCYALDRHRRGDILTLRHTAICALICALAGGIIEVLQWVLPTGRTAEWGDFLADTAGAAAALASIAAVLHHKARR